MANTLTKSTTGYAIFETNEGKTAGNTYSGDATNTSGHTFTYRNIARNGDASNIVVEGTDNADQWIDYRTYTSSTSLISACWWYPKASQFFLLYADNANFAAASSDQFGYNPTGGSLLDIFINNSSVSRSDPTGVSINNWYFMKAIMVNGAQQHLLFDATGAIIKSNKYTSYAVGGTYFGGIRPYLSNGNHNWDNWSISKSNTLTVAGLTAGMSVVITNNAGTELKCKMATGTSVTFDLSYDILPLGFVASGTCGVKFLIYGTDSTLLLTTALQTDVFGGDTWTYSGETAGPSGGNIINVINNGV